MSLFDRLMTSCVAIRRRAGSDAYGTPSYAAQINIRGRLAFTQRELIDGNGQKTVSDMTLYTPDRIATGDLVTVGGEERPVLRASEQQTVYGTTDHWEAML